jgi:hypothetical protein
MTVESLFADVDAARNAWNGLVELLNRGSADFARERPMLGSISLQDFQKRVNLKLEVLDSIRPTDPAAASALVLNAREGDLQPHLQALSQNAVRDGDATVLAAMPQPLFVAARGTEQLGVTLDGQAGLGQDAWKLLAQVAVGKPDDGSIHAARL